MKSAKNITAVDLFCGAGGLSQGLLDAGLLVEAGIDFDEACEFVYETNIGAKFIHKDIAKVTAAEIKALWRPGHYTMLAGCAPCQPFSTHRRGANPEDDSRWELLNHFARLVRSTRPHFVTMENVPGLARAEVFTSFVQTLRESGYDVAHQVVYCPDYGLAQQRRRLVLIASRIGTVEIPEPTHEPGDYLTVRKAIGGLRPLDSGGTDSEDPLHKTRDLTEQNLKRIRASRQGGTWLDWPVELRSECHKRSSGSTFRSVYARMEWDKPSPTITTQAYNFGTGRFGHPEQDRAISLREAATLQGFPSNYVFSKPEAKLRFNVVGRLIGNAVPPVVGKMVGSAAITVVKKKTGGK